MTGDGAGNLYLTTGQGETIVRVRTDTATASITTLAGSGHGYVDGVGAAAQFSDPDGIAIDGKGNLFVAEFENHTIRKIAIDTGTVTTVAGAPMEPGSANGAGGAARFKDPTDLAYDRSTDTLYVADVGNGLIRRIDIATNMVMTLAGDGRPGTLTDGTGTSAAFDAIGPMIADGNGNLYVGDRATIRKIELATGVVMTIAGTPGASVSRDGIGATALITFADGLALDGAGGLYFSSCQTIRKLDLSTGAIVTLFGFPDFAHASLLGCATHGRPLHGP
jgi:DNA-binding beta-propeller fold protein YncE